MRGFGVYGGSNPLASTNTGRLAEPGLRHLLGKQADPLGPTRSNRVPSAIFGVQRPWGQAALKTVADRKVEGSIPWRTAITPDGWPRGKAAAC